MTSALAGGGATGNNIKVVARFRPQNKIETANGGQPIVEIDGDDTCKITSSEVSAPFTFDRVFGMDSRQPDIFEFSIRSTVEDVMNGYNGTVFAYGQTGAGKSYTMMGDMDDPDKMGIIPRIVKQIFDAILLFGSATVEYTVGVSYMEIYMERIRDLLNPVSDNLPIHEGPKGPYVKDLREIYVSGVDEVLTALHLGQKERAVASTNMNQESSRSHSIFCITINQRDVNTGSQKSGMLYLVDLAGSEKVGKTGATGQTLEEAKKINKSLSALGMVINSLTDGKSTHIPYRDSKLTRILQESLGGNSRTTLIINCSPSSYNDQETISTLRFGTRAKTIKNKAKINAELSPAELKRQLKAAQHQAMSFEKYIASLDEELSQWRRGDTVPREKWVQSIKSAVPAQTKSSALSRPETPSRMLSDHTRSETPARSDSRAGDRASTPSLMLERDEREEFRQRENELQDQLAEKEKETANAERILQEIKEELRIQRENYARIAKEAESTSEVLNKAQMELQRLNFEREDEKIEVERMRGDNDELDRELNNVRQQLLTLKIQASESSAAIEEKEQLKKTRMKDMLAGFDVDGSISGEHGRRMQDMLDQVDQLQILSADGHAPPLEILTSLRGKIIESRALLQFAESTLNDPNDTSLRPNERIVKLEDQLSRMQSQHEALLIRNLSDDDVQEIQDRFAKLLTERHEQDSRSSEILQNTLSAREGEIVSLRKALAEAQRSRPDPNGTVNGHHKSLQQQMADFDVMKKNLMRDLQNRCERVVELEISLDETREQYNNVLKSSNNRQQQKKMAFLERNLEQLTVVQRQLVDQNTSLKKEVAIAERKLLARNDRILALEQLLSESQEKLAASNHKYVDHPLPLNSPLTSYRFEAQLSAVKERLEAAKISQQARNAMQSQQSTGGPVGGSGSTFGGLSFGARIAKPLRGGGGAATTNSESVNGGGMGQSIPYLANLSAIAGDGAGPNAKRGSWFFNK